MVAPRTTAHFLKGETRLYYLLVYFYASPTIKLPNLALILTDCEFGTLPLSYLDLSYIHIESIYSLAYPILY